MTTALTLFTTTTNDTLLTTARQLVTVANVTGAGITTKTGTSTGWGELLSQGSTATWPAGGSAPNPSGKGFIWNVTTLEAQYIDAGVWTPKVRLRMSVGTVVADVHLRAYKRSSAGVYTLIGDFVGAATTVTTTNTTYSLATQSLSPVMFGVGDKMYIDCLLNITTNSSGSASATLGIQENDNTTSLVTPGYDPIPVGFAVVVSAQSISRASLW